MITPVGLDYGRFKEPDDSSRGLRFTLGLSKSNKVLLYIGTIEHRRHVDLLVKVVEKLPEHYVMAIVGKGPLEEQVKKYSEQKGLSKRVFWLGKKKQEELPAIYKDADLFLLASDYEIYGMVILESLYWGTPVLATVTGGSVSIIKDGEYGFLINSFDEKEWSDKIVEIFKDEDSISKMRNNLREYIVKNLTWDATSSQFIKLYKSVLE